MLLSFDYLYEFVMFYLFSFLFFQKAENNRLKKKPVGKNIVLLLLLLLLLLFLLKIGLIGPVGQQIN